MTRRADTANPIPPRVRVALCTALATVWGFFICNTTRVTNAQGLHRDFGQLWYAGRAVLARQNPYEVIGLGKAFNWYWPWYYPLPAAFLGMPFAPFSEPVAVGLFVAVTVWVFTWALTEHGYPPLLCYLSICTWLALALGQGAPFFAASLVIPPIAFFLVCKPTIGAAFFAARPSWWAVAGGVILVALSFAVQPHWVSDWMGALHSHAIKPGFEAPHRPPVTFPGGILVFAALTRWRRPEARLLVAMACVPQTTMPHEVVPLFLIPRGWIESVIMLILSHAMVKYVMYVHLPTLGEAIRLYGQMFVWFMYLPGLLMILRRPNVGAVPAWLEERISAWPAWLRGRAPLHA